MKIYLVIGIIHYEDSNILKAFSKEEDAKIYKAKLEDISGILDPHDEYCIQEIELHTELPDMSEMVMIHPPEDEDYPSDTCFDRHWDLD